MGSRAKLKIVILSVAKDLCNISLETDPITYLESDDHRAQLRQSNGLAGVAPYHAFANYSDFGYH